MAESQPIEVTLPPGILAQVSPGGGRGRYIDCDKVRFYSGLPEKMGGARKYVDEQMVGIARGSMAWQSQESANQYFVLGTAWKAYAILDMLDDITPLRESGTLGLDPFTMVNASAVVTVHDVAHGIEDGAYVHFSGATAARGITVDGEYPATVIDADNYTITHSAPATSSGTGGGAAVAYKYEINPGLEDSALGLGVGVGPVGAGTVGSPRSSGGVPLEMRTWSFDNYGTLLMLCPSGGTIYTWDEPAAADRAVVLTNAPAGVRFAFITPERMFMALGITDEPMKAKWNDRDDPTNWTPAIDNTANERTLQDGNRLIAGARLGLGDASIIWSDTAAYLQQYIGSSTFIYDIAVVGRKCGLAGPCAFLITPGFAIWYSPSRDLFVFSGGVVARAPNFNDIADYIRTRADPARLDKMAAGHTPRFSEVWFHYVSIDSPDGEPDEFFCVNYADWVYYPGRSFGSVGRTAHVSFDVADGNILMAGADGYIYQHEYGVDLDGGSLDWFLQSGISAVDRGRDMDVNGFIPDWERIAGTITLTIEMWEWPNSQEPLREVTTSLTPETARASDISAGGRYASLRYSGTGAGSDFRLGIPMFDAGRAGGQTR